MRVRNNDVRVITVGGLVNLVPGVNQVDDALWKKASGKKQNKVLKALFDGKTVEVLGGTNSKSDTSEQSSDDEDEDGKGPASGAAKTGRDNLSDLNAEEARELISDTLDRDTLEAWRQGESRKTVLAAIDEQLELTKAG